MCRQAHACDRQLKEINRYALSNRLEQQIGFFCLLQSEATPVFFRQLITNVRRPEKNGTGKKRGPETHHKRWN
jgi:hypothetical protein